MSQSCKLRMHENSAAGKHILSESYKSSATLNRFFQGHGQVCLQPANSAMGPMYISKQERDTEWQIQGKVVAIFRQYHAA